ncbi:hypothetical protein SERLA73DRAFT_176901 [Serpula lacrymans var. lacrymans S7.3]|uniref:Uncharacterized protein n=1 Tax=Serpula lacrymans var. lacrymans (strain S7.3) TaxID=936435 RepID=F8PQE1_SERL3|nr:hypothetical protein SERLA73DRAFT_176901 [Serpula lacrymans var. lacrymans S7.3]
MAHNTIIESRVFQAHQANRRRQAEYVLRKNQETTPKCIGPFKIAESQGDVQVIAATVTSCTDSLRRLPQR